MQESKPVKSKLLPANAYRKLEPGEVYNPVVAAADLRPEVTLWSIGLGVAMVVLFTAACAYMALRAGNAIEASIPIAILAIFFGKMRQPVSTLLENVMLPMDYAELHDFDERPDRAMEMLEMVGLEKFANKL